MLNFLLSLFGDPNNRKIKKMLPIVEHINALEEEYIKLTDDELRAKTQYFKDVLKSRPVSSDIKKDRQLEKQALDAILPEAFATVREAGKRVLNMRHFDVQLLGGIFLHEGHIAEMRTGEGKTLVATLPAYLNALTGKGVHIVTVNDYLAKRDSEWMGRIFTFLGLSVGVILSNMNTFEGLQKKRQAYLCDITYGTNNEFGFDYLRDNMALSAAQRVQRPYNYAIIDEVDSILIDEARTPLIISGRLDKSAELYRTMAAVAPQLEKNKHYEVDEKNKNVILTEEGIDKAQEILNIKDLFDINNQFAHHLLQALKAKELFHLNTDYVIKNGQVMIVDEFTGRLMEGRRWSDGLHQAVEAKEGVEIQDETQTLASITFQNLFRLYPKLSGMTGTALTEEAEFGKIYNLEVTVIPTNKPDRRINLPDIIYKTEKAKYNAVVDEIIAMHNMGRPVLVGTISIDKSELVSDLLKKRGIKHNILNAKLHEKEAYIIAQAGRLGAVTIATNMAGRGTDILLGGNSEYLAKEELDKLGITPNDENYETEKNRILEEIRKITDEEHKKVVELGGLHVIGTERHESRRIDNQLRGRAARQNDPGSTRFFLSLEDNLMRIFGGSQIIAIMNTMNLGDDIPIESKLVTRQIASNQKKVETFHFDARKSVLEYDDVMNLQREKFYAQRNKVIEGTGVKDDILFMIEREVDRILKTYIAPGMNPDEYIYEDLEALVKEIHSVMPQLYFIAVKDIQGIKYENVYAKIRDFALEAYREHERKTINFYNEIAQQYQLDTELQEPFSDKNIMRQLEKDVLLRVVDNKWIDHLHNIDMLRDGIGLRAYGQKNPLLEYKKEAFDMFNNMMYDIQSETVKHLFRTKFGIQIIGNHPPDNVLNNIPEQNQDNDMLEESSEVLSLDDEGDIASLDNFDGDFQLDESFVDNSIIEENKNAVQSEELIKANQLLKQAKETDNTIDEGDNNVLELESVENIIPLNENEKEN